MDRPAILKQNKMKPKNALFYLCCLVVVLVIWKLSVIESG